MINDASKMKKSAGAYLFFVFLFVSMPLVFAGGQTDSLLMQLDRMVKDRRVYGQEKELRINKLNDLFMHTASDQQRFNLYGSLFSEYHLYNTDSSLFVARERLRIARRMENRDKEDEARMNISEIMGTTGMFKEALDLLSEVKRNEMPIPLLAYKYHIYRTIYGLMMEYAVTTQSKEEYAQLVDQYRDSLLLANTPGSATYQMVEADRMNTKGEYDAAISLMAAYYRDHPEDIHINAIITCTLAESYAGAGNKDKEEEYLILSSMSDLQSAVREYISLRKLALLLYEKGDIDRAYSYLQCCMEDALLCNARLRLLEILKIFPFVNHAYEVKAVKQQERMKTSLILISLLSVCLLFAIFYVYWQMKKLSIARREVENANYRLKELNDELLCSNAQLKEANSTLKEVSCIKDEYIGRYMGQCSLYIDKIDTYRRSLGKIAAAGKVDDLFKVIKSTQFIEDELKDFYAGFDRTFLYLFPTFVEEFNALLTENEKIPYKPGELLATELRIFALIRLGISDSGKIAHFLRYSVTTIYNYRSKMRNKAAGERENFEKKVMQIGK